MNDKKLPPTHKQIAGILSEFIVDNFDHCPIHEAANIQDCNCWCSTKCVQCLQRNAEHIKPFV